MEKIKLIFYLQITLRIHAQIQLKILKQVGYKVGKVGIWTFAIVYEYEIHIIEVHNLWLMCVYFPQWSLDSYFAHASLHFTTFLSSVCPLKWKPMKWAGGFLKYLAQQCNSKVHLDKDLWYNLFMCRFDIKYSLACYFLIGLGRIS